MFTGLIQAVGRIAGVRKRGECIRLAVEAPTWRHRPRPGDSISVSGVCLTLAAPRRRRSVLEFDAVPETLARTTLGALRPGSAVNLEHAATPTTLLGGHLVQGHVDGVGTVAKVRRGDDWRVYITPPRDLAQYIVPKGSICIDGVSLTVAGLSLKGFHVALIPTTLEKTTLARLRPGDGVNLEADLIAKTTVFWLQRFAQTAAARRKPSKAKKVRGR